MQLTADSEGSVLTRRSATFEALARSIRAHETYALTVSGARDTLPVALGTLLGPSHVTVREHGPLALELVFDGNGGGLSDALDCILRHGGRILRCEPQDVSLGDVFRNVLAREHAA